MNSTSAEKECYVTCRILIVNINILIRKKEGYFHNLLVIIKDALRISNESKRNKKLE